MKFSARWTAWRHGPMVVGLIALSAVLFSLLARIAASWDSVTGDGAHVQLLEIDPYYHLRHTLYAVEHFPNIQRWDVGTHYPTGERSPHAGLFNLTLAALALILGLGEPSDQLVTWVVAWSPVFFHALVMLVLYRCACRLTNAAYGAATLVVFALFPGQALPRTTFGFGDHHAAEILLVLLIGWGTCSLLEFHEQPARRSQGYKQQLLQWLKRSKFTLPLLAFQFTWSGAPIAILQVAVALSLVSLVEAWRDFELAPVGRTLLDIGSVLVIGLLGARLVVPNAIMIDKLFAPSLGLSAGVAVLGLALLKGAPMLAERFTVRGASRAFVASMIIAGVVVAGLLAPDYFDMVFGAKTRAIREHQEVSLTSFLYFHGVFGLLALASPVVVAARALRGAGLGPALFVSIFTVLLTLLWFQTYDYGYDPPPFLALASSLVIWYSTRPWHSQASVELEATRRPRASVAIHSRTRSKTRRPDRRRKKRKAVTRAVESTATVVHTGVTRQRVAVWLPAVLIAASAIQVWPARAAMDPLGSSADRMREINRGWFEAMQWFRSSTEEPTPGVLARVEPWRESESPFGSSSYGVAGAWDYGNFVSALGRRTPLASHQISLQLDRWLVSPPSVDGLGNLCPHCESVHSVRYVVLSAPTLAEHFITKVELAGLDTSKFSDVIGQYEFDGHQIALNTYGAAYEQSLAARLYLEDGNGLGRYRLVYASPHRSLLSYRTLVVEQNGKASASMLRTSQPLDEPKQLAEVELLERNPRHIVRAGNSIHYSHHVTSSVKIFEVVPGVSVEGIAWPGARVTISLSLEVTTTRERLTYRQSVQATNEGRFRVVCPYSVQGGSDVVVARSHIELTFATDAGDVRRASKLNISEAAVRAGKTLDLGRISL